MFRAIILSSIFFLVSNVCLAQFSRNVIVSTGGLSLYEQLEKERIEAEKAAEAERIAQEEAEKKAAEQARIQAEQKAEAEKQKTEAERLAKEEKERKAAEAARIKAEQKAEADRLAAEEARIKAEKKAEEEKQKAAEREQKKQERKARIAAYPWSHMIMVNAGLSSSPDYAFGLTYAYVKQGGFYVSAMSNFGFKFNAKYDAQSDGSLYKTNEYPFYTGKTEYTRLEATVGGMVRMRIPLYAYAGVGYGYRGLYCEAINGEWVRIHNNSTA
jgi:actin-related protein